MHWCQLFISVVYHLYRYKDTDINKAREKIFNKKFMLGKTSHVSIIVATLPVHVIYAHLALKLCRKELELLFTRYGQVPRHNGKSLD